MSELLRGDTLAEWVKFAFDRPVTDPMRILHNIPWEAAPQLSVEFLKRVFEEADRLLSPFSDAQVNQGLTFLIDNGWSNTALALRDESVPWDERRNCIRSFSSLYQKCFAPRCSSHLCHEERAAGDATARSPLNSICYMWWDILPFYFEPNDQRKATFDAECLRVMEATLKLNSIACQESALHGLGHWEMHHPKRVRSIIDEFLLGNAKINESLREYAEGARMGLVN